MTFVVLYVCTGNVCRSPAAELLFQSAVAPDADIVVHSAGMMALVGAGVDPPSAAALAELDLDPRRHRARQFEPWMAARADLVLTAERAHRDAVIIAVPTALRRAFTVREFARLAPIAPRADPAKVVAHLARHRGEAGVVDEQADSISDPYRQSYAVARITVHQLRDCTLCAVDALGLGRREAPVAAASPKPRVAAAGAARRPRPGRPDAPRPGPGPRPRPRAG